MTDEAGDHLGAVKLYDQALAIYERLLLSGTPRGDLRRIWHEARRFVAEVP